MRVWAMLGGGVESTWTLDAAMRMPGPYDEPSRVLPAAAELMPGTWMLWEPAPGPAMVVVVVEIPPRVADALARSEVSFLRPIG